LSSYSMTLSANSKSCYVKFSPEIDKEEEFAELLEVVKRDTEEFQNFIYDLSDLRMITHNCHRVFAMVQHHVRSKKNAVLVIIPPELLLKRRMMDDGLIRPTEICISLVSLKDYIKAARAKVGEKTKDRESA
jgi:hypothetical protein